MACSDFTFSHNVNIRGQTKVEYIKICYKTSSFIWISGSIFWNLTKLCMNVNEGYAVLIFHDLHLRGQTNLTYVLKHPLRLDIFKHTYRNVCLEIIFWPKLYICTYASLNTCGIKYIKLIIVWNKLNLFDFDNFFAFFATGIVHQIKFLLC